MRPLPEEVPASEAERIAYAYRLTAGGNAWDALLQVVEDTLADLAEAERRTQRRDRLISKGYVRSAIDTGRR